VRAGRANTRRPPRWTSRDRGARHPAVDTQAVKARRRRMNCQSPFAPARDTASGLNPLSIMAVKASSSEALSP